MKKKYLQLIEHSKPFLHYAIHEALMEEGKFFPYWVGSKPLRKFDNYAVALDIWCTMEKQSAFADILHFEDVEDIIDKVDYSDDEIEIDFED